MCSASSHVDAGVAESLISKGVAKLRLNPNPGVEAMVVHLAKCQNTSYVLNDDLTLHSVNFAHMTDEHKMQIGMLIESLSK